MKFKNLKVSIYFKRGNYTYIKLSDSTAFCREKKSISSFKPMAEIKQIEMQGTFLENFMLQIADRHPTSSKFRL